MVRHTVCEWSDVVPRPAFDFFLACPPSGEAHLTHCLIVASSTRDTGPWGDHDMGTGALSIGRGLSGGGPVPTWELVTPFVLWLVHKGCGGAGSTSFGTSVPDPATWPVHLRSICACCFACF